MMFDDIIDEFSDLWKLLASPSKKEKVKQEYPRIERLNNMEIEIIEIVYYKKDVILKEICTMLDIPKSTLTSAIDRLEKLNYVNRTISKRDRRSYGLELTDEGYKVQNEYSAFERRLSGDILSALDTDEEKQQLMELLRKIVDNI